MPKLGEVQTEKLVLPSSQPEDEAFVVVRKELLLGDVGAINNKTDDVERLITLLTKVITDWSFTVDGTPNTDKLPITEEWVSKLGMEDFGFLAEWIGENLQKSAGGLDTAEKKTSSATSIKIVDSTQI